MAVELRSRGSACSSTPTKPRRWPLRSCYLSLYSSCRSHLPPTLRISTCRCLESGMLWFPCVSCRRWGLDITFRTKAATAKSRLEQLSLSPSICMVAAVITDAQMHVCYVCASGDTGLENKISHGNRDTTCTLIIAGTWDRSSAASGDTVSSVSLKAIANP